MSSARLALVFSLALATVLTAAPPRPEDTWPGFRGHSLSGVAPGGFVPERWSVSENVRWKIDVPGRGWSSPIVWGDTVFLTSAISSKPFKQPSPGLYGNDYIAELRPRVCLAKRSIAACVLGISKAAQKPTESATWSTPSTPPAERSTEEGLTFVIAAGDEYREIGRNDLAEMSLASPAIAGGALYIRTESKLYKIQHPS